MPSTPHSAPGTAQRGLACRSRQPAQGQPAMEVLMITPEYPPDHGGVADYTANLVHGLATRGLQVHTIVLSRQKEPPFPASTAGGPQRHPAGLPAWLALLAAARARRRGIVHLQYVPQGYARRGVAPGLVLFAALLRLVWSGRLVFTMHELWIPFEPRPARLLAGLLQRLQTLALAAMSDAVVVTTMLNRQRLSLLPPPLRPVVRQVPVGSNIPVNTPQPAPAPAILRCVPAPSPVLAVFSPHTVAKAFAPLLHVLEALPQTYLLCIGGLQASERAGAATLRRTVEQRGLAQRVLWTGYLPAEQVAALLQRSTLYLHLQCAGASFRSTAIAAAMQHRLPIVAYRGAETEAAFIDGATLCLVDQHDPLSLVDAVRKLLGDPALRQDLARGGYRLWHEHSSWERIAAETLRSYEGI